VPILGVGVDIENIERFREIERLKSAGFLNKIFTKKELNYCFSKADAAPHLAARFAGKEAIIKSLNSIEKRHPPHNLIEIVNNKNGVPLVRLCEKRLGRIEVAISLSHSKDVAIAFAIAREGKKQCKKLNH